MPYFTIRQFNFYQPFKYDDKTFKNLDKYLMFLEESGVGQIIQEAVYKNETRGRKSYNPYLLFAAILYGFTKCDGSLRKLEETFKFDTRFLYILENETPSYVSIENYLNNIIVKKLRDIYTTITLHIIKKYNLDVSDVFVDGTKLEANANKYKFVYRPTIYQQNLNKKVVDLLSQYFEGIPTKRIIKSSEIGEYINKLKSLILKTGIVGNEIKLRRGRGVKNPKIVKDYFELNKYLCKMLSYEEINSICGENRNSFYKTDNDATAMCLKEDYYSGLGSNTHAAYNVQNCVSSGLILYTYVCQDRNDTSTLIPVLKGLISSYGFLPENVCADAGYGSLENYLFLEQNKIGNYIKFNSWEKEKNGETIPLYTFDDEGNLFCLRGKKAYEVPYRNGYRPKKGNKFYRIDVCYGCRFKIFCNAYIKNPDKNFRIFETNYDYNRLKEIAKNNLLSPKGIEMRVNRSCQVEGSFGVLKQDMNYARARRRGLEKVSMEIMLFALPYNIKKLLRLLNGEKISEYWTAPKDLKPEVFKEYKFDKVQRKKILSVNQKAKKGYKYRKTKKRR